MVKNYVEYGVQRIARVNIIATVVDSFTNEDGSYLSLTLDDGTSTIRAKAFNEDAKPLGDINKGERILMVGRVREYQGEIYLAPEITKKVNDPNIELIRKAELLKYMGIPEKGKISPNIQVVQTKLQQLNTPQPTSSQPTQTEEVPKEISQHDFRQKIISSLAKYDDSGVEISTIAKDLGMDDQVAETIFKDLLLEGEVYENKPGHYKAI